MSFIRFVLALVVIIGVHKPAHAQNDPDEFLDDDEPFDEQVDDKGQRGSGPRSRGPSIPKTTQPPNTFPAPNFDNGSTGGPSSGEVSFHLVDPPKYWQPKKRHHRNQAKDQKDMHVQQQLDAKAPVSEKQK